jgi:hypothetical protein
MKSKIALFLELAVASIFVSVLSGCFGDGGVAIYDGTWTAGVADSAPITISGVAATCTVSMPLPTITLANGIGSTSQTNICSASGVPATNFIYLVSVAVDNSTGVMNAIVNGSPLTGQCISSSGCSAQDTTLSLSLTR